MRSRLRTCVLLACGLCVVSAGVLELRSRQAAEQARSRIWRTGVQEAPPWYTADRDGHIEGPVFDLIDEAARRRGLRLEWTVEATGADQAFRARRVDLWPLAGKLAARHGQFEITEAWLRLSYWLARRKTSQPLPPLGAGLLVAHKGTEVTRRILSDRFPRAGSLQVASHVDALQALCAGTASAAVVAEVFRRGGTAGSSTRACVDRRVDLTLTQLETVGYGIGSRSGTPGAQFAAEELRAELMRMVGDGSLTGIFLRWGVDSSDIRAARSQYLAERAVRAVLLALALLILVLAVLLRYHRRLRLAKSATDAVTAGLQVSESALVRELAHRREVEERLRYQAQLLAQVSDAIVATDLEGNVTFSNEAAEMLNGRAAPAVLGRPIDSVFECSPVGASSYLRSGADGKNPRRPEDVTLRTSEGTSAVVQIAASGLYDDAGEAVGSVLVFRDITHLRQLEAQNRESAKLESIGRLAGGVAHDFNNLLTIINGYSGLSLERLPAGGALHSDIEQVRQAGERAAALTRQLLAFSRRQVFSPEVTNLNGLVREVVAMLERTIGDDIVLEVLPAPDLHTVLVDPHQMHEVILNLAVNARDAMPDGGKLLIETRNATLDATYTGQHPEVGPGDYAMLAVTDSGVGMDDETMLSIFEPFFTTKSKGTGLGLATVHGIVRQSGGSVWVHSELGRGTTFRVYLPRYSGSAEAPRPAQTGPRARTGSETILVVEDHDAVRRFTVDVLRQHGYLVLEAALGAAALQISAAHQGAIHLLLTDVEMPGMSGRQIADALAVSRPGLKTIFVSGYTEDAVVTRGVLKPGVAYLPKPFSPEGLVNKIRDVLGA